MVDGTLEFEREICLLKCELPSDGEAVSCALETQMVRLREAMMSIFAMMLSKVPLPLINHQWLTCV